MSRPNLSALFKPLRLAGTTLPNRVMTSAMTLQYGEDGLLSDRHLAFYRARAEGGAGLLFSEQMTASPISGSPFANGLDAFAERQVDRFAALARTLEPYPTRFFAQLFAGGVVGASTAGLDAWGPVRGPSRVGAPGGEAPLPLRADELARLCADFARSAANVKAGGLDGVELHGAHGWLVGQFLSPFYNRRADEYGGSVANRCRLAIEIGAAIREEVGEKLPIGLALTYDELIGPSGITEADTLAQLEELAGAGVFDFFDLSVGSPHARHHTIASMAVEEGFPLAFARRARRLLDGRAAVFVAGRVVEPAMAAAAVAEGVADVVAMSRAHLADPALVSKAREGRLDEVTRCVGANVCVGRALEGQPVACVLSPATGREVSGWAHGGYDPLPARGRRRVLVVGSGPAGLRAAAVVAARGDEATVFERRGRAGGHLTDLSWLHSRRGWGLAVEDMLARLARSGAALRLSTEVDPSLVAALSPDVVLLATGAAWESTGRSALHPQREGIPIAAGARVLALDAALDAARRSPDSLGAKVLVLDETGTYAPLGLAEALAAAGGSVEVVTPLGEVGGDAAGRLELQHLLPRLRELGVELTSGHRVEAIDLEGVDLADVWGGPGRRVEAVSSVVVAAGRAPRDELLEELDGLAPRVEAIGDARAPRSTEAVIHEAEAVARTL